MAIELYNDGMHKCLMFSGLAQGEGIQSNQFFVIDDDQSALIDPGGHLSFTGVTLQLREFIDLEALTYVMATHQGPDAIGSLESWVTRTNATIVCPKVWSRCLPHLLPGYMGNKVGRRMISVPDEGMNIQLGRGVIKALPAHFLNSAGNLHFYDPVSKILYSGDMGSSLVEEGLGQPVEDFEAHVPAMEEFHRRHITSNKVCRMWVAMVRNLDVEMIVPQHGRPFKGKMVREFLNWVSGLDCGIDLLNHRSFFVP